MQPSFVRHFVASSALCGGMFRPSKVLRSTSRYLTQEKLDQVYYQEAYESLRRLKVNGENGSYPGAIKATSPGDTQCYMHKLDVILPAGEKHYWRPVVDDVQVRVTIPVRIRFKEQVFMNGLGWETHMNIVLVHVAPSSTIGYVISQALLVNSNANLGLAAIVLVDPKTGKQLPDGETLQSLGLVSGDQDVLGSGDNGLYDGEDEAGDDARRPTKSTPADSRANVNGGGDGDPRLTLSDSGSMTASGSSALLHREQGLMLDAVDVELDHREHQQRDEKPDWIHRDVSPQEEKLEPYGTIRRTQSLRPMARPNLAKYGRVR